MATDQTESHENAYEMRDAVADEFPPAVDSYFNEDEDGDLGGSGPRSAEVNNTEPRARRRSDTVRRISNPSFARPRLPQQVQAHYSRSEGRGRKLSLRDFENKDAALYEERDNTRGKSSSPSGASSVTNTTEAASSSNGSGSSSSSGSTVTQLSYGRRNIEKEVEEEASADYQRKPRSPTRNKVETREKVDVMSFLEADSPDITEEVIQRTMSKSTRWKASRHSPSARSASSSSSSNFSGDVFSDPSGDHESDRSSSPEASVSGDSPGAVASTGGHAPSSSTRLPLHLASTLPRPHTHRYGTPEMPRGTANLPHLPASALQPRKLAAHVKHLPRAEKLPLTGYDLLASKLSAGSPGGATIKPLYRRFETLNHRILLHLQDELSELEEQLRHLDTTDTQTRRAQDCILPASRRNEQLLAGELQWHKAEVLGKIGYKLAQYNNVLSSFTATQNLPSPPLCDIQDYRSYLATHQPIVEPETRFLDPAEDLVSVGRASSSFTDGGTEEDVTTPMPRKATFLPSSSNSEAGSAVSRNNSVSSSSGSSGSSGSNANNKSSVSPVDTSPHEGNLPQLAVGMAVSILLPILTFPFIPGFLGRMIVVFLVGLGVLSGAVQGGFMRFRGEEAAAMDGKDWFVCAAAYGGVMAIAATLFA